MRFLPTDIGAPAKPSNGMHETSADNNSFSLFSLIYICVQSYGREYFEHVYRHPHVDRDNYHASSQHMQCNPDLPVYLHNQPRQIVEKCMKTYAAARYCQASIILKPSSGREFDVPIETVHGKLYHVSLGSDNEYPFCECLSFKESYLPCNGFAQWDDLAILF